MFELRQPQVNYKSPSKIGVISRPDASKEKNDLVQKEFQIHDSSREQSEAEVTDDENGGEGRGVHKESNENEIRMKKRNSKINK